MAVAELDSIHVLHVDDDQAFAELAAKFVERQDGRVNVETTTDPSEALDRIRANGAHCVVSDYDMPERNGIEFLEAVREESSDLPFILFTGKGSEEVATEAIHAGVTDYLQKESGTSQYEVLANRIRNAVEQHRAQEIAEETEHRLQTIAENTNDILWKFTGDWEELLFINSPYEEIWGRSIDELRERPQSFLEGIHPEDRDLVKDAMGQLSSGESVDIEYRVNANEDFGRWIWVQGKPVFDDAGEVKKVVGFARDITGRKERVEEIEQLKDRFQAFTELSSDVITVVDETGSIRYESPSVKRVLGYEPDELIKTTAFEHIHPEDREEVVETFEAVIGSPGSMIERVTYRFKHADGSWVWLESVGSNRTNSAINGYVINSRDVTDRKEREQEIQDLEAKYRSITNDVLGATEVGIFVLDADFSVAWCNRATEDFFGIDPDEVIGRDKRQVIDEEILDVFEDPDRFEETVLETYDDNTYTERFECHVLSGDSRSDRWLSHLSHPIESGLFEGGRVEIYTDITARKEREQRLERQNDRLDEFTSIISHDLRNPLRVASGALELGREECDNEDFQATAQALDQMHTLINDVLELARTGVESTDPQSVSISEVVEENWRDSTPGGAKSVVNMERPIQADSSQLNQLLGNLIRNAAEHSELDVTVTIGELPDGFYVEDDGPGIPVDEREKVFETGYSSKSEGTGFGLNVVRQVVEAHGWDISVSEGDEGGARFEVTGVEFG